MNLQLIFGVRVKLFGVWNLGMDLDDFTLTPGLKPCHELAVNN